MKSLSLFFFVLSHFALAQSLQTKYLVDVTSGEKIPFAHLTVLPENYQIISSSDGSFEIHATDKQDELTLIIDALGYEPYTLTSQFSKIPKKIKLTQSITFLDEVVLEESVSPRYIIKKVIENLKGNFSSQPFNAHGYFRKSVKVNDSLFLDLEFVNEIYHRGYHQGNRETHIIKAVRWNKGEVKKPVVLLSPFLARSYQVNIKYKPFFEKRKIKNFKYTLTEKKVYQGREVYVIRFSTDKTNYEYTHSIEEVEFSGLLFIDAADFSILKVIEERKAINENEFKSTKKVFFWEDFFDGITFSRTHGEIDFQKNSDGKYYMSKAAFKRKGCVKIKKEEKQQYEENFTIVWFGIQNKNVTPISFKKEQDRLDKVPHDEVFWKNFKLLE